MSEIEMPESIRQLPMDPVRKLPVPWFVSWINGKPEFRRADAFKHKLAIEQRLCWVCGRDLVPNDLTFVLGPMCTVNRISAEPPCHLACAVYSAKACPFLSNPNMIRREKDAPPGCPMPGVAILRNPGVAALWRTESYRLVSAGGSGVLFNVGRPFAPVLWFAEGRLATRAEVEASFASGLPALTEISRQQGPEAEKELQAMAAAARQWWPAE